MSSEKVIVVGAGCEYSTSRMTAQSKKHSKLTTMAQCPV